jgi:hypothetical protein
MRNLRIVRRGDDMPLYGTVTRIKRGLFEVTIKFVASKRMLHKEQLSLPDRDAVKRFYEREFPTLTWGEPTFVKPRLKVTRKSKPPASKRVSRKRASKRKKRNAVPSAVRLRH